MSDDYVTASEIGDWLYCRRQWWYARRRVPRTASPRLERGIAAHEEVAARALRSEQLRGAATWLVIVGAASLLLIGLLLLGNQ